jgi:hypothetical protein
MGMPIMTRFLWLCALLLANSALQAGNLYKWKDANGVTQYTGTPPATAKYETRRIDSQSGWSSAEDDAQPAESAQCSHARKNLQVLTGKTQVKQDSDGDGSADTILNEEQRASQKNLAEAAIKAYCAAAPAG